jgi:hypothetical protein
VRAGVRGQWESWEFYLWSQDLTASASRTAPR